MIQRRLWVFEGVVDVHIFGALGETSQLDRVEKGLFWHAQQRYGEDETILNLEAQLYAVSLENRCNEPTGRHVYPLNRVEVEKEIIQFMKVTFRSDLPEDLLETIFDSTKGPETAVWHSGDRYISIKPLGPGNWNTL